MDLDIIEQLKDNEFNFCKTLNPFCFNIDNKFITLYNPNFDDDYFFNRTVYNQYTFFESRDNNALDKDVKVLMKKLKNKKIPINLHVPSNQTLLEKFLLKRNFKKIDEVIGLQYPLMKKKFVNDDSQRCMEINDGSQIFIINNVDQLKEWIVTYCSSFNICIDKKVFIYHIIKRNFRLFQFILFKKYRIENPFGEPAGCCLLFSFKYCVALYCLGTIEKYRNRQIATKIIDFAIESAQKNGFRMFGLQTLQSDNLVPFYEKRGFVKIYKNNIYQLVDS